MVTTTTRTIYTTSDGKEFLSETDAYKHEALLALKAVCDENGYTSPHFTREDLYALLLDHAEDFVRPLVGLLDEKLSVPSVAMRQRAAEVCSQLDIDSVPAETLILSAMLDARRHLL